MHWLGTDALGRDLLARVLVGGRTSLLVGLAATLVSVAVGVRGGGAAGYFGGSLDEALMRIVDFLYGIPYMFLVILVMLLFSETARGEALPVFVALGLVQWLTHGAHRARPGARAARPRVRPGGARARRLATRASCCATSCRTCGSAIVVYATLTVPSVIILESFLSFLGLGVSCPGASSWRRASRW